jgi:ribosomal protein S27AE
MTPTICVWKTDDPCPLCGTSLTLTDHGDGTMRRDCPLCGWSAPGDGGDADD